MINVLAVYNVSNHCPTKALSHEGDFKEIQEIVDVCMQDIDFYEESNGGVNYLWGGRYGTT